MLMACKLMIADTHEIARRLALIIDILDHCINLSMPSAAGASAGCEMQLLGADDQPAGPAGDFGRLLARHGDSSRRSANRAERVALLQQRSLGRKMLDAPRKLATNSVAGVL
jgi:hypothetical protein